MFDATSGRLLGELPVERQDAAWLTDLGQDPVTTEEVQPPWSRPANGYHRTLLPAGDGLAIVFRDQVAYVAGVG